MLLYSVLRVFLNTSIFTFGLAFARMINCYTPRKVPAALSVRTQGIGYEVEAKGRSTSSNSANGGSSSTPMATTSVTRKDGRGPYDMRQVPLPEF